jgi:hypothetical protein
MFINATTKVLFGPKELTTGWPAGVPMLGLQGVKGDTGARGLTGPQGSTGATGATGVAGFNGSNGAAGSNGSNGSNGSDATLTCAQGGTCVIGSTGPGGGKVFYISATPNTTATPWRYLEAAPNTWSGGVVDPTIAWCSNTTTFVAALTSGSASSVNTLPAMSSGFSNTRTMLGTCTFGAANMAASYNGGGKSDWFLPSSDELNQMCKWARAVAWTSDATVCTGGTLNLGTGAGLGAAGFVDWLYLSSSERENNLVRFQRFDNGNQGNDGKNTPYHVRPIRAF